MIKSHASTTTQTLTYLLSREAYDCKPEKTEMRKVGSPKNFERVTTTAEDLSFYLHQGYAVCPTDRGADTAKKTPCQMVIFDIDDSPVAMSEYVETLKDKPSFYYRTYSDGVKGFRFRLVYVFERPFYGSKYMDIHRHIAEENGFQCVDVRTPNQLYFGTYSNFEGVETDTPHTITLRYGGKDHMHTSTKKYYYTYAVHSTFIVYEVPEVEKYQRQTQCKTHPSPNTITFVNDTLVKDFWAMPLGEWSAKYNEELSPIEARETPYEESDDERLLKAPMEFYKLPRKYKWNKDLRIYEGVKWKDGERRHMKLYVAGVVYRRLLAQRETTPTADDLLVFLVAESFRYYENFDGKFTKSYLLQLTESVMNANITTPMKEPRHSKTRISDDYCRRTHRSKKEVLGEVNGERMRAEKEKRYAVIDKFFNPNLTDAANLETLEAYGLTISIATLKRYRKERGIKKYKTAKNAHTEGKATEAEQRTTKREKAPRKGVTEGVAKPVRLYAYNAIIATPETEEIRAYMAPIRAACYV